MCVRCVHSVHAYCYYRFPRSGAVRGLRSERVRWSVVAAVARRLNYIFILHVYTTTRPASAPAHVPRARLPRTYRTRIPHVTWSTAGVRDGPPSRRDDGCCSNEAETQVDKIQIDLFVFGTPRLRLLTVY